MGFGDRLFSLRLMFPRSVQLRACKSTSFSSFLSFFSFKRPFINLKCIQLRDYNIYQFITNRLFLGICLEGTSPVIFTTVFSPDERDFRIIFLPFSFFLDALN